jgi:transcriptional regulator with XRE-family HTH domain
MGDMAGPTVRRLQLGKELKRLREAAGISRPAAAAAIKCSPSRMGHIEGGRNVLGYTELVVLVRDLYGTDAATLGALEELREEASKRGWWSQYGLPEWLAGYVGLEHDATSVRTLELKLIPGLLQTEEYARTLYTLSGWYSAKQVDQRVAARLKRQERLVEANPLHLVAVVDEAALRRCVHMPLAAAQLSQLIERAGWPNIELRILPFGVGLHVGVSGAFSLLSFPDRLLADAAYQEYAVGGHVIDDESVVGQLDTLFSRLRSQALAEDESLAMIAEYVKQTQSEIGRREASDER